MTIIKHFKNLFTKKNKSEQKSFNVLGKISKKTLGSGNGMYLEHKRPVQYVLV